jgi:DNA modification methylase
MNAPARTTPATPILRNAAGEPPLGIGGLAFRDEQGEMFFYDRDRSPAARFGVLELEDGSWLVHPFHVESVRFFPREDAMRHAIAGLIRKARKYIRAKEDEGIHWGEGLGGRVIEWALSIKPEGKSDGACPVPPAMTSAVSTQTACEIEGVSSDHSAAARRMPDGVGSLAPVIAATQCENGVSPAPSDPIVAELVTAHRARKVYPAGHTFSMTNPVLAGAVKTVGTCSCGHIFVFPGGDHERMDAAIEAHLQKFDHLPEKVDGRGQPIAKPKKPRRKLTEEIIDNGNASQHLQPETGRPDSLDEGVSGARAGDDGATEQSGSEPSREQTRAAGLSSGASQEKQAAGVASGPSETITNGMERLASAPAPASSSLALEGAGASNIADVSPQLRSEPVPSLSPDGAGSSLRDEYLAGIQARTQQGAPIGAGSVADVRCEACAPAELSAGESAAPLSDDDDLAIEWPSYDAFLEDKIVSTPYRGIEIERASLHPWLKDFNKDIVVWALRLGCAAIFAECGLHKTAMQLEWARRLGKHTGGPTLNVLPLGCRHGFINEAEQKLDMAVSFIKDAAALGINARYIEHPDQMVAGCEHYLTNYEPIRDGKLDPNLFAATSLDEASVLRSYGSKTFQEFLPLFSKVPFKLVATATPAPNRFKELIHYAGFLGVMDTGQALTRFFQRDTEQAGNLTLYPHMVNEFWMWVHSWAAFVQRPSDLGYSDEGYDLPPVEVVWHEVAADHSKASPDRDGQGILFRNAAQGLSAAASSRRDSLSARVAKAVAIKAETPDEHCLWWHDLEAERLALESAVPGIVTITGSGMDLDTREKRLIEFEEGLIKDFGTKPILSGLGSNFQYHCNMMIFVGMPGDGYKFELWYQAIKRLQRYGQTKPVKAHMIYSEDQREGRAALERKLAQDTEMRTRMIAIIRAHGLNTLPMRDALARSIGVKRVEIRGERFIAVNNDTVAEAKGWVANSVDQIITSIPFLQKYEYAESYNDFGHTEDAGHFWGQMDFLTAELLRMLKPGRMACIHVKDEIEFGSVTGEGVPTVYPFHCEAIMHYRAHGFQYCGEISILTDVVTENAGNYRLGWSKNAEDSTTMGVGCPEKVLLFRKPQTDKSRGWADIRVTKQKPMCTDAEGNAVSFDKKLPIIPGTGYSRARWQIDAHAFWRSSGNRVLTMDELLALGPETMSRLFPNSTRNVIYDYEEHVRIGEELERRGRLPTKFMCLAPGSWHPDIWDDVDRMRTLNMYQAAKGREKHICPLQFDTVDRLIDRYSNEGDLIYDPFGGIMTVPYRAILKGRRGAAVELNSKYFLDGVHYLRIAEEKMTTPQLFDLATFDAVNTPPQRT